MNAPNWKVVECLLVDLEARLNELVKDGWHIWPQQIHLIGSHDEGFTAIIICSKEVKE